MTFFFYNILACASLPFVVAYHFYRSVTRGRRAAFVERFGFIPTGELAAVSGSNIIWVHAVSVGETIAATPLIKALRQRYPEKKIIISNVTETGREVAQKIAGVDLCIYFPFDYPFAVSRALDSINPSLILIMETEIWPNFIRAAKGRNIPVLLVNGRISDRSFSRYLNLSWFFRPVLQQMTAICMQTDLDAERITAIGALPGQVRVTRNLKYDIAIPGRSAHERQQLMTRYGIPGGAVVFTAGSTHDGEEQCAIAAYQAALRAGIPAFMVLVPRHPERARQVSGLLAAAGFFFRLRSELVGDGESFRTGQVLLVDTVGELLDIYAVSHVVFVGGSLVPTGGHNVLEPAALGVPVLFGPHMDNFREISALVLSRGAGMQVHGGEDLANRVIDLCRDEEQRRRVGASGIDMIRENSGSVQMHLAVVDQVLETPMKLKT